ncbi:MAG: anhydro-N-acetylmuramic acid kinase [Prevotellaceae bacterium]|jgi:anhydro-N-acetylmuramic acid kinase|nr:anhydro-N-acetylmuramic acid kinase [Prevotellaceae bacterium]
MVTARPAYDLAAVGVMSGTSLDGLDVCLCRFRFDNGAWRYDIVAAETTAYPAALAGQLATAQQTSALQFAKFHADYGTYIGEAVRRFIDRHGVQPALVASHGHTVFHQPERRFTCQVGSGAHIAAAAAVDTVCDFRSTDVALGGQGAPLVPVGDRLLFPDYAYCLNLGGFANISYEEKTQRTAYDICAVNYVLNHYIRTVGLDYDRDGATAASGAVDARLLDDLDGLDFYARQAPKSLGREWVEQAVFPVIDRSPASLADKLRTYCEHAARQIGKAAGGGTVLVTGGGAHHSFLMERIAAHAKGALHVPDACLVDYKEALIFAFLGVLYYINQPNCLASVTGAEVDSIGGAMYKSPQSPAGALAIRRITASEAPRGGVEVLK